MGEKYIIHIEFSIRLKRREKIQFLFTQSTRGRLSEIVELRVQCFVCCWLLCFCYTSIFAFRLRFPFICYILLLPPQTNRDTDNKWIWVNGARARRWWAYEYNENFCKYFRLLESAQPRTLHRRRTIQFMHSIELSRGSFYMELYSMVLFFKFIHANKWRIYANTGTNALENISLIMFIERGDVNFDFMRSNSIF